MCQDEARGRGVLDLWRPSLIDREIAILSVSDKFEVKSRVCGFTPSDCRPKEEQSIMFEQLFDSFLKVSESTLHAQQEFFHQWISQWPMFPIASIPSGNNVNVSEQARLFQKQWADTASALLTKQCDALDAQYRAGIRTIENVLRSSELKSPEEYRRLTEDLWRKSLEQLKQTIDGQIRDFETAIEKWSDLCSQKCSKA
jgi:hypothetical protein